MGSIRVVIAKAGLDGHDRGAKVVARALRDAGVEVIYTGLHQTPAQIVATAIQEDASVVGLSVLSGAHLTATQDVITLLREQGAADVRVIVGGIIPDADIPVLRAMGVHAVFTRRRHDLRLGERSHTFLECGELVNEHLRQQIRSGREDLTDLGEGWTKLVERCTEALRARALAVDIHWGTFEHFAQSGIGLRVVLDWPGSETAPERRGQQRQDQKDGQPEPRDNSPAEVRRQP